MLGGYKIYRESVDIRGRWLAQEDTVFYGSAHANVSVNHVSVQVVVEVFLCLCPCFASDGFEEEFTGFCRYGDLLTFAIGVILVIVRCCCIC